MDAHTYFSSTLRTDVTGSSETHPEEVRIEVHILSHISVLRGRILRAPTGLLLFEIRDGTRNSIKTLRNDLVNQQTTHTGQGHPLIAM